MQWKQHATGLGAGGPREREEKTMGRDSNELGDRRFSARPKVTSHRLVLDAAKVRKDGH